MNITKIYLVENCFGISNKVYIGKTKNSREKAHKRKFGEQIKYTYIDSINSLEYKDWKPLETYWINQFKAWGFDVLNENEGGGGPITHSEEIKKKISDKLKNKQKPPRTKKHCNNLSKSLIGKSRKGNGRKRGTILSSKELEIRRKKRKKQSLETIEKRRLKNLGKKRTQETKIKMSNAKKGKPSNNSKPVFQYDLNNNLIKIWKTVSEAALFFNIRRQGIVTCAINKSKTYKNYIWKYY
jgi:hypothetical protein